jgi:hypothetical protein
MAMRPINRALGFGRGLKFSGSLAHYQMVRIEQERPFPQVPPDALNYAEFYFSIFHRWPR